jgi:hypothetical protein
MEYMQRSGFKVAEDGSILARYGTQTNCAGIAQIQVSIEYANESKIEFLLSKDRIEAQDDAGILAGKNIPEYFASAIFLGAEDIYFKNASSKGIKFTLIKALVHPIDANEMVFKYAGKIALAAWYQLQSNSTRTSLTFNELYEISPHLFKSDYDDDV